jgi:hypothetical protein
MRDTPPYLTDAQVDATYNEACAWMFGTSEPLPAPNQEDTNASTVNMLRREVRVGQQPEKTPPEPTSTMEESSSVSCVKNRNGQKNGNQPRTSSESLQRQAMEQRLQRMQPPEAAPKPIHEGLTMRTFRQGIRTNTAVNNPAAPPKRTHAPTATELTPLDSLADQPRLHNRQSTRQPSSKRVRYEPAALGQEPKDASGFSATNEALNKHLIVDTGASHVLFREQDSHVLAHVQWSVFPPFAILKYLQANA